jgi:hypothetical protein
MLSLLLMTSEFSFAAEENLHEALDRRYRFSKHLQSEINIFGGDYLGDETHNSWDAGAKYFLHLNNMFAVGASYTYTPIYTDSDSTFGRTLKSRRQHIIDAEMMIANDAAIRAGGSIIECDMFMTFGVGTMWINEHFEPVGVIGGGIKVYTPLPWIAVRFDVNTYLHPMPNPLGDTFNADMQVSGGVSFLFPTRPVEQPAKGSSSL